MVEVPELNVATQGKSRAHALHMLADAIESLVNKKGFKISVTKPQQGSFLTSANDPKIFMAFFLKQQRELHRLTVREVAKRLSLKSHASYAQYEQGKSLPGMDVLEKFIQAINPKAGVALNVVNISP